MITLRVEPQLFTALRTSVDGAVDDPDAPIDPSLVVDVHSALAKAKATALTGLPILVTLPSVEELDVLSACFEVGGEGHPDVTDHPMVFDCRAD